MDTNLTCYGCRWQSYTELWMPWTVLPVTPWIIVHVTLVSVTVFFVFSAFTITASLYYLAIQCIRLHLLLSVFVHRITKWVMYLWLCFYHIRHSFYIVTTLFQLLYVKNMFYLVMNIGLLSYKQHFRIKIKRTYTHISNEFAKFTITTFRNNHEIETVHGVKFEDTDWCDVYDCPRRDVQDCPRHP